MLNLKSMKIWVCWVYQHRDGKKTKKPVSAYGTPTGTDAKYSHSWVTFEEAQKAMHSHGFDGIGFIVPKGYCFLDIDHREKDDPLVQAMILRFESYTEYSVSGTGIHIYGTFDESEVPTYTNKNGRVKLDQRYYSKNSDLGIELYLGGLTNRFAVYTGDVLDDKELADCTDAVISTLNNELLKKDTLNCTLNLPLSTELKDILTAIQTQRNGKKFMALYRDGNLSGYRSHSEADLALCSMLAFRTGPDSDKIDQLFRASALYREDKWEREDYRSATINKAIESCNGTFYGSVPPFIKFNRCGSQYVSAPLLARYVREHVHYLRVRDNGRQGQFLYVYGHGVYTLSDDDVFLGIIKQFVVDYDEELLQMRDVREAYSQLMTDLDTIGYDELNSNETIINFANGILTVGEEEILFSNHSPEVYSTIQLMCDWSFGPSPTPVFDAYLDTLTNGDEEIKQLLLEFIGVVISNIKGKRLKKALFLVGDGNTGKSQLKALVERILGKGNYMGTDLKEIESRFGTGAIFGKRLVGTSDMSFMKVDELRIFKRLTGGDSIFAEDKHVKGFEYTFDGLLWFCMNRLARFGGDDGHWVYDRIMVVNCPNVVPLEKQDKHLLDKMFAEREGIVQKAVIALQTVIANGYTFTEPESVKLAREEYCAENSSVISFFNECMCRRTSDRITDGCTTGMVYNAYKAWCNDNNGGHRRTAKDFRNKLAEHLGTTFDEMTIRHSDGNYYINYTLTDDARRLYINPWG